jgi:hypothetical protein
LRQNEQKAFFFVRFYCSVFRFADVTFVPHFLELREQVAAPDPIVGGTTAKPLHYQYAQHDKSHEQTQSNAKLDEGFVSQHCRAGSKRKRSGIFRPMRNLRLLCTFREGSPVFRSRQTPKSLSANCLGAGRSTIGGAGYQ